MGWLAPCSRRQCHEGKVILPDFMALHLNVARLAHDLRNEVVEELIPDLVSENLAGLDVPHVRGGRTRGMENEKGKR